MHLASFIFYLRRPERNVASAVGVHEYDDGDGDGDGTVLVFQWVRNT